MFQAEECPKPPWHQYCCKKVMVIAAFLIGAGVVLEICAVITAPMGYQDETGFHLGVEQFKRRDGQPG